MIPLSCSGCGKQLKVKEELAGKKVRCPQCKQVVAVPASSLDDASVLPRPSQDPRESATLPPAAALVPHAASLAPAESRPSNAEAAEVIKTEIAYEISDEIARGGMGAIMRAVDPDIQREVAVKFLLNAADARQKARFVEEAQITGQLEHPNIVPIHHLGVHADGRCFFSMKMVRGRSLADVLKDLDSDWTLGRLLTVFGGICNAMAYAHARQVIHRDLKPANVMVGDFGEVYVMDWGLAKVLSQGSGVGGQESGVGKQPTDIRRKESLAERTQPGKTPDSKSDNRVTTNRLTAGDLTQAGAILGTPAYMPPEQAQSDEVDERADIYSLGAILYEILTLTPPVGRDGDLVAIVLRVVDGKIDPPALRAPKRARAGWVPPELSAIAMKALAKDRGDRYQSVADLQRDIQLYQEGRSVSAKQDSVREQVWKLIKRNKAASMTAALALVVLAVIATISIRAILEREARAVDALARFEKERDDKRQRGKDSAPLFVQDARTSANRKEFDHALAQVEVALDYDPDLPEAHLMKGQLLIARHDLAGAVRELEIYLRDRPEDKHSAALLELAKRERPRPEVSPQTLSAFAGIFFQQAMYGLVDQMEKDSAKRLKLYRDLLEAAWKGRGKRLSMKRGKLHFSVTTIAEESVKPLEGLGLPLNSVEFSHGVRDLSPLAGMPLEHLNALHAHQLRDLTPLKGMPLTRLEVRGINGNGPVEDLEPLRGMPLKYLDLAGQRLENLAPLAATRLEYLDLHDCPRVSDLSPLAKLPLRILYLNCPHCKGGGKLRDLSALRDLPLKTLALSEQPIEDEQLPHLQKMPLEDLQLRSCPIKDLTPLKDLPLRTLNLSYCKSIRDLGPLRGLKELRRFGFPNSPQCQDLSMVRNWPLLDSLTLEGTQFKDVTILKGLPLKKLSLRNCKEFIDLSALPTMPLEELDLRGCSKVKDLTPLAGMKLKKILFLDPRNVNGLEVLVAMRTLAEVCMNDDSRATMPMAEFRKRYAAGEYGK